MPPKGPGHSLDGLSLALLGPEAVDAFLCAGVNIYHTGDAAEFTRHILSPSPPQAALVSIELIDAALLDALRSYKGLLYLTISAEYDTVESSPEIAELAVEDYIRKPLDAGRITAMIATAMGRPDTGSTELAVVEPAVSRAQPYFVFRSPRMRQALRDLDLIAASAQGVLITGETGTGKELVARAIHALGPRAEAQFVPVNCGAIPEHLIEAELFGHEKGAFTGAHSMRRGKFEVAHNGTLFLDEVGDMPVGLQVKLLRALEDGAIFRLGGERPVIVDVRVVAATQVDIERAVEARLFREDLYYRLNVLRINIPPLRRRLEDIPLLAVHFLERVLTEQGRTAPYPELSAETIALLQAYPWRGNVRELRNIMARIATLLRPTVTRVLPHHVTPHLSDRREPSHEPANDKPGFYVELGATLAGVEDRLIRETLKYAGDNRTRAASMLDISVRNLRRKLNSPAK